MFLPSPVETLMPARHRKENQIEENVASPSSCQSQARTVSEKSRSPMTVELPMPARSIWRRPRAMRWACAMRPRSAAVRTTVGRRVAGAGGWRVEEKR